MTQRSSTPSRGAIKFEFSWTASRQQTSSALPMPLPPMSSFILMLGFVPSNWAKLTIAFKLTAPSRLYWAGRPAMRVVQALHWVRDLLPTDQNRILKRLQSIISDISDPSTAPQSARILPPASTHCLHGCRISSETRHFSATLRMALRKYLHKNREPQLSRNHIGDLRGAQRLASRCRHPAGDHGAERRERLPGNVGFWMHFSVACLQVVHASWRQ